MKEKAKKLNLSNSEIESIASIIVGKATADLRKRKEAAAKDPATKKKAAKVWSILKQLPPGFRPVYNGQSANMDNVTRRLVDLMKWPSVRYKTGIVAAIKVNLAGGKIYKDMDELIADIDPFIMDNDR